MIGQMMVGDSKNISITHLIGLFHDIMSGREESSGSLFSITENGISYYQNALYEMEEKHYSLSVPVKRIAIEEGKVVGIETSEGFIEADEVICCTTANTAKSLCQDAPSSIRKVFDAVSYSKTFSYMIGDTRKFLPEGFAQGCIAKPGNPRFRSVFSQSGFNPKATPNGQGDMLHCYTSDYYDKELIKMTDQQRNAWVLEETRRLFPKLPQNPQIVEWKCWDEAISMDAPGQMTIVYDYLENHVDDVIGLSLAAEYMFPVACSEGAMTMAKKACDHILQRL